MKKIWITGAEGHIGTALLELLEGVEYQLLPTDIHEVDITKIDEVTQFVYVNRPDVIINCAGMTDVAECEKNIDEAYRVNAIGVRNVALAANDIDAKVIQISTDDVFDKESRIPYNEFDTRTSAYDLRKIKRGRRENPDTAFEPLCHHPKLLDLRDRPRFCGRSTP